MGKENTERYFRASNRKHHVDNVDQSKVTIVRTSGENAGRRKYEESV